MSQDDYYVTWNHDHTSSNAISYNANDISQHSYYQWVGGTWVGGTTTTFQCTCSANGNTGPCTCQQPYHFTIEWPESTEPVFDCLVCGESQEARICLVCVENVRRFRDELMLKELKELCE